MFDFKELDRLGAMADKSFHGTESAYVKIKAPIREITNQYVVLSDPKKENDELIYVVLMPSEISALRSKHAEKLYIWGQLTVNRLGYFMLCPERNWENKALVQII
jgi:hypothetical protein